MLPIDLLPRSIWLFFSKSNPTPHPAKRCALENGTPACVNASQYFVWLVREVDQARFGRGEGLCAGMTRPLPHVNHSLRAVQFRHSGAGLPPQRCQIKAYNALIRVLVPLCLIAVASGPKNGSRAKARRTPREEPPAVDKKICGIERSNNGWVCGYQGRPSFTCAG
jgi:hypothetical protein